MSKKQNSYLGKAGQFAIMSEFLCRGWNVAIPEVDVGDDIFVVRDADGNFIRVQVKTATGKRNKRIISAQFNLRRSQLKTEVTPMLVYAFLTRFNDQWLYYALIRQDTLLEHLQDYGMGAQNDNDQINITFALKGDKLFCRKQDFSSYVADFREFPVVEH